MEARVAPAGVVFRPLEESDAAAVTALRREADDTTVWSEAGSLSWWSRRHPPDGFRCVSMAEFADPVPIYELTRVAIIDEPRPIPADDLRYDDWIRQWEDPDLDRDASALVVDGDRPVAFAYVKLVGDRASH